MAAGCRMGGMVLPSRVRRQYRCRWRRPWTQPLVLAVYHVKCKLTRKLLSAEPLFTLLLLWAVWAGNLTASTLTPLSALSVHEALKWALSRSKPTTPCYYMTTVTYIGRDKLITHWGVGGFSFLFFTAATRGWKLSSSLLSSSVRHSLPIERDLGPRIDDFGVGSAVSRSTQGERSSRIVNSTRWYDGDEEDVFLRIGVLVYRHNHRVVGVADWTVLLLQRSCFGLTNGRFKLWSRKSFFP